MPEPTAPPRDAGIKPAHEQGARDQGRQAPRAGQAAREASREQRFVVNDVVLLVLLVSSILVLTFVILSNQQRSAPTDAASGGPAELESIQPETVPVPAPDHAQDKPVEPEPDPNGAASDAAAEAMPEEKQEHEPEPEAGIDDARRELEAEIQAEWERLRAEQQRGEPERVEQVPPPAEPVE